MAVEVNLRSRETTPVVPSGRQSRRRQSPRRNTLWIWLFLTPTVVLYGVYTVYPIFASYWFSFLGWNGFEETKTWVGRPRPATTAAGRPVWPRW